MRIVKLEVKDLENLLKKVREHGYVVEQGPHAVLLDHSELSSYVVKKDDKVVAEIVAHYLTQYYLVEMKEVSNDDDYLREPLRIKNSGVKWSIPVNDVLVIIHIDDNEFIDLIEKYSDVFPIENGEEVIKHYKEKNPGHTKIPNILLARILDESTS
ncbi:MAG: hypothetical protein J7L82_01000 [Staphylothermus sp.]|nr:hypothetical protein [Staphylothermus sp.]